MLSRNLTVRGVRWLVMCVVVAGVLALGSVALAGPSATAASNGSVEKLTPTPDAFVALPEGGSVDVLLTADNGYGAHPGITLTGILSGPSHGSATPNLTPNVVRYVPTALYSGTDQFTCSILDASSNPGTLVVSVTVTEVNQAPVTHDDTFTVPFNYGAFPIWPLRNDSAGGADESGQGLVITSVVDGSVLHGTAWVVAPPVIYYEAPDDFRGIDSLQYVVRDDGTTNGMADPKTAIGTVHFIVGDNTAPVITVPSDITAQATGPDGAVVTFSVSANDDMEGAIAASATPESGSRFPVGETTVSVTATDTTSNPSSKSFRVNVVATAAPVIASGINADKARVLAELRALAPTVRKRDRWLVNDAILHLRRSLSSSRWVDSSHPRRGDAGAGVYDQEALAVEMLSYLRDSNHGGVSSKRINRYITRLARVDRALAAQAIAERARYGNSSRVRRARASLALGDKDARHMERIRAIRHYRDAWRLASGG